MIAQSSGDTIAIHLNNVDLRAAVQMLGQYIDRPVIISNLPGSKVTIETPKAVRRSDVLGLLRATLASQNLELVADSAGPYRIQQKTGGQHATPEDHTAHSSGDIELFVIHLRHARATDVAATVNALYGRASALGELSAQTSPTLAQELRHNVVPATTSAIASERPNIGVLSGQSATLTGETSIIPDPGTNSLLIRASPRDYALIEAAVKELDVRPLQVLIEVLIAEVRHDRSLNFGVDIKLPPTPLRGHPKTTVDGTQTGIGIGDLVLHVMGIAGEQNLEATLRAAASHGDVTILSRPTIIAVNNESAEINVGSQRPFVQVSRSLPTDAPTRDQVVQYKDVGTKLSIRPTISADGYVMLQVTQEISAATNEVAFDAPVISTRSVQTQLLLKDGQTAVIGGLTDRQKDVSQGGIPILSSIPLLGGLFGHTSRQVVQTELFLFITPRVIKNDADVDSVTASRKRQAGMKQNVDQP